MNSVSNHEFVKCSNSFDGIVNACFKLFPEGNWLALSLLSIILQRLWNLNMTCVFMCRWCLYAGDACCVCVCVCVCMYVCMQVVPIRRWCLYVCRWCLYVCVYMQRHCYQCFSRDCEIWTLLYHLYMQVMPVCVCMNVMPVCMYVCMQVVPVCAGGAYMSSQVKPV